MAEDEQLETDEGVSPIEDAIREQQERIASLGPEEKYERKSSPVRAVVFGGIAFLSGLFVLLSPLAYMGIYVEPLRQFWRPWAAGPGFFGVVFAIFVVTTIATTGLVGRRRDPT